MKKEIKVIDCFCGAGGLSLGFEQAGFTVAYAFDIDASAINTYSHNKSYHGGPAYERDIHIVSRNSIEADLGRALGDVDVVIGGPPCQGFSVQRRGSDTDTRNDLVLEYIRLIQDLRPRIFVMENVLGILSARGREYLRQLEEGLGKQGYLIHRKTLLASDYGVPQSRKRVIIVGELCDNKIRFSYPEPTTKTPVTVRDSISDLMDKCEADAFNHKADRLSPLNLRRIRSIKEGEGHDALPVELQLDCHKNNKAHRHLDTYGRMAWDEPAPTITARFDSFSRGRFGHPVLDRTITLREGARLQTFPDDFEFLGNKVEVAKQIGNAVPPKLAKEIAECVKVALGE